MQAMLMMPPDASHSNTLFFLRYGIMKYSAFWLAFATATFASSSVFSVHDDLLAFPQVRYYSSPKPTYC